MRRKSRVVTFFVVSIFMIGILAGSITIASANIGSIFKGAGIMILVDQFSGEINNFVNTITLNKGFGAADRTKVVPIISIGDGTYTGAAQVSGPARLVDRVNAVAQLEATMVGRSFRVKALVPVESRDIVKEVKRVDGVGVSAIIDIKL